MYVQTCAAFILNINEVTVFPCLPPNEIAGVGSSSTSSKSEMQDADPTPHFK